MKQPKPGNPSQNDVSRAQNSWMDRWMDVIRGKKILVVEMQLAAAATQGWLQAGALHRSHAVTMQGLDGS